MPSTRLMHYYHFNNSYILEAWRNNVCSWVREVVRGVSSSGFAEVVSNGTLPHAQQSFLLTASLCWTSITQSRFSSFLVGHFILDFFFSKICPFFTGPLGFEIRQNWLLSKLLFFSVFLPDDLVPSPLWHQMLCYNLLSPMIIAPAQIPLLGSKLI